MSPARSKRPRQSTPARSARVSPDAVPDPAERKEKVLHTRVPQSLDRQLKQRARNLGLSVSTVVRHVLLNTFGLVEDIVTDSANLAMSIAGDDTAQERSDGAHGRSAETTSDADIVGWQEVVLNVNGVCERCNALLRKGMKAAIAVRERFGPRAILCTGCFGELAGPAPRATDARKRRTRAG